MLMATYARTFILILAAYMALYATRSEAQTTLKVSAIPDEAPTELQRKFAPLGKYLEAHIGMPVEFIPVTDYAATVEGLAARKLDMVWYGGFTFVQARIRTNGTAIPLVQRVEDEKFQSVFITQPNSGINSLADLKNKTFTFGSPSSTSGHLMPRWFLLQQGIDPDKDFRRVAFSGAHDATALQVAGGKVDAGAMNISVWHKMLEEKKLDDVPDSECKACGEELRKNGHHIAAEALQSIHTATTVRVRNGKVSVTDGPFAETKEQLAGFYLIDAKDLNEAIQLASKIPPARVGSVEVRPTRELAES